MAKEPLYPHRPGSKNTKDTFLDILKDSIEEEKLSAQGYRSMSLWAERDGKGYAASIFSLIASQEDEHYNKLVKIYNDYIKQGVG
jgi:ferritin